MSNWTTAAFLICFNPLTLIFALKYYRRLITVGVCSNGLIFVRREVIEWSKMDDVSLKFIEGLPHIAMKELTSGTNLNIPLFVQNFQLFVGRLRDNVPKGHAIAGLIPEIEKIKIDELPT